MKIQPPLNRPIPTRIAPHMRLDVSIPPQNPSQVLPGLTSGASLRFPNLRPVK
jgi:hypothetical protein